MSRSTTLRTPEDSETDPDGLIRLGTVASVDLAAARCTVKLDDDAETGPVRWLAARLGKTRVWSPPSEGEQVILLCPGGEIGGAVAITGLVCDTFAAPSTDPIDLIEFEDGSKLSYDAEASELVLNLTGKMKIVAPDGLRIEADVVIQGDVDVTGTVTATADVIGGGKHLKTHTHPGVQTGGGSTGAPS